MDGVSIPTKEVMQEVVRAQIQNYVDSEEGKGEIQRQVWVSIKDYFENDDAYMRNLWVDISNKIITMVQEKLGEKHSNWNLGEKIFEIGLIKWMSRRGYEVKKKK